MLGGQGQLGLQHQGGGEAGRQEVLVEAQIRRVDWWGRRGGHGALGASTARLLLLDEGAHVEWSGGLQVVGLRAVELLFCLECLTLLLCGLAGTIRLSISLSLSCDN